MERGFGFTKVPNSVAQGPILDTYAFRIYVFLNSFTQPAFPSISTIQRRTSISRKKILSAISLMEGLGLISVDRAQGNRRRSNRYTVIGEKHWRAGTRELVLKALNDAKASVHIEEETADGSPGSPVSDSVGNSNKTKKNTNLTRGFSSEKGSRRSQPIPELAGDSMGDEVLSRVSTTVQDGWLEEFGDEAWLRNGIAQFAFERGNLDKVDCELELKKYLSEKFRKFPPRLPGTERSAGELLRDLAEKKTMPTKRGLTGGDK